MLLPMRRAMRYLAALAVVGLITPVTVTGIVLASFIFLPLPVALPEARPTVESQISRLYDIDGNEIGTFRTFEQSVPVRPEDIPQVLKDAVIAAEDRNFYEHGGVDIRGTLRALWADIRGGSIRQGGSTITQQYVKNAYTGRQRTLERKVREAIYASQLDRQEDKEVILFKYLSTIYLGDGAYGVGAASESYFRKPVSQLTLSEAALLTGLIPAPSRYAPRANPYEAEHKRRVVLGAMLETGKIDRAQYDQALAEGLWLSALGAPDRPATVVHPLERQEATYPYFQDYVQRYLEAKYGSDRVFMGGLDIYTTLDPEMQEAAEKAVSDTLNGTPPGVNMSLVAVEPQTGYVNALIGGRDFATSKVNLALGGKFVPEPERGGGTGRQPGSAFKPFVLATAFDKGVQPSKTYPGSLHVKGDYTAHNYGGSVYGTMDLRSATRRSVNTVFTRLIDDVGVEDTMKMANRMGLHTEPYDPARHGISVALGSLEVSPLNMASAFGVFAARGQRAAPTPVVSVIVRQTGEALENNAPERVKREQVLKEVVADNVTAILRGVLEGGGTAGGKGIGRPAAGKTGTAQDNKDAWFVGYTPSLSTAVWMGYPDPDPVTGDIPLLKGIKGVSAVTGGSFPASTWQAFMKAAHQNIEVTDFNEPAPIRTIVEESQRRERRGFSAGVRRSAEGTSDGGSYVEEVGTPTAEAPPAPTTTTTTTIPFDDGSDDDDDDGGGIVIPGRP